MDQPQPHRYFIINKPYNMVSQFIGENKVPMLGNLDFDFPEGIHAVGRLDAHSEGLLILTTNKKVTRLLFQSKTPHKRVYLVRVKNLVNAEKLEELRTGVTIRIKDGEYYTTPPSEIDIIETPENLFPHQLELRDYIPHSWLRMTLYEGKYHQVRKMVSAINHPCKRLVRVSIEDLELGTLAPGEVREMSEEDFFRGLHIDYDGGDL
jgi:23S rRNA pseudouridine2457 synthase